MVVVQNHAKCINCGVCISVCPRNVWKRVEASRKPSVQNKSLCIECGACVLNCEGHANIIPPRFWQRWLHRFSPPEEKLTVT